MLTVQALLGSWVYPCRRARANGWHNARGGTWAITPRRKVRRARAASTSKTAVLPDQRSPLCSRASSGARATTNGRRNARESTWGITRRRRTRRVHTTNTSRTASIPLSAEKSSARNSRVSTGTRSQTSGGRNTSGTTWAVTPRRRLRRARTPNT